MKLREVISDGTPKGMVVGTVHLLLIVAAYTSPFWLDWKVITAGVALLTLQFLIFKGCILNKAQYGDDFTMTGNGLYEKILTSFGIDYDKRRLKIWLDWVIPSIVLVIALIWQLAFKFSPPLKL